MPECIQVLVVRIGHDRWDVRVQAGRVEKEAHTIFVIDGTVFAQQGKVVIVHRQNCVEATEIIDSQLPHAMIAQAVACFLGDAYRAGVRTLPYVPASGTTGIYRDRQPRVSKPLASDRSHQRRATDIAQADEEYR